MTIDIKGKSKAKILAALYNASRPLGMGMLHYIPGDMTEKEAEQYVKKGSSDPGSTRRPGDDRVYFDYLKGRVLKVDLTGDSFDPFLYDRDNGEGAAERALKDI